MLVLFDLDGTLIDSEPGITASLGYAFAQIGAELPAPDVVRSWIGPPFAHSFPSVLGDDEARIAAAIDHYRVRFEDIGWSEHRVYAGIADVVAALAADGHRLAIVTHKPLPQARRIVDHFPFASAFGRVYGPDPHGHQATKAEMIARALVDFATPAAATVMIGDRRFDIEGAVANDVHAIGVTWGFGSRAELVEAGADALVADAAGLLAQLRRRAGDVDSPDPAGAAFLN